jgi:hypothetical protein
MKTSRRQRILTGQGAHEERNRLLVESQKPEDRIAELERQLAEANRTVEPYTGSGTPPGMPPPSMTSAMPPPPMPPGSAMPPIPTQPYSPTGYPGSTFGSPFGGGPTPYGFGSSRSSGGLGSWFLRLGVFIALAMGLFGFMFLHQFRQSPTAPSVTPSTTTSDASMTGRWTSDALTQAFAAINDKIGANPADYSDVNINASNVAIKAINPQNHVDQYTYDGSAVTVTPIISNAPEDIVASAFKSDIVQPSILAAVMNSAVKDSGVQDVTSVSVFVTKHSADDPAPSLDVSVSGRGPSKDVFYDLTTGQFQKVA